MKSNKIGMHVKGNINGSLRTLFGMIKKFEQTLSRTYKEGKVTENFCLDKQTEKTLLEAEIQKSQAIGLIRKPQNC